MITKHASIHVDSRKLPKKKDGKNFTLILNNDVSSYNGCAVTQVSLKKNSTLNVINDVVHLHATCVDSGLSCPDLPKTNTILSTLNVNSGDYLYFTQSNEFISIIKPYNQDTTIDFNFTNYQGTLLDYDDDCDFLFHLVRIENYADIVKSGLTNVAKEVKKVSSIISVDYFEDDIYND